MIDEYSTELFQDLDLIIDESEKDETVKPVQYEITSFGADIDTEGFVKRLERNDVYIPPFQRDYVWTQREASRFIESLLLGLPVPGVFLARESDSKRLLVIDGQQRLKTLQFFFSGFFNHTVENKSQRVFQLQGVQEQFEGKTYETLAPNDRITINDSIIHATIVKQESPANGNSSIYHIFERLNTSGRKLSPQQIRVAIYHGFLVELLHDLNKSAAWREVYGKRNKALKDEELILRFFALFYFSSDYSRPMKDFLNTACESFIKEGEEQFIEKKQLFTNTIDFISKSLGKSSFRPERGLNAAVYDAVMIGTARSLSSGKNLSESDYKSRYEGLLRNKEFAELISRATADEKNVLRRLELATEAFSKS